MSSRQNIVFITRLYPTSEKAVRDVTSFALHEIVRNWIGKANLLVVVPERSSLSKMGQKLGTVEMDGVRIVRVPFYRISKLNITFWSLHFKAIAGAIKDQTGVPDVVVGHLGPEILTARKVANQFGAAFVAGIHVSDIARIKRAPLSPIVRKHMSTLRGADGIACRSMQIRNFISDLFPEAYDRIFLALSGVPKESISPIDVFKAKAHLSEKPSIKIIAVANLKLRKRVDLVIDMLREVRGCNWQLTIVGDGPDKNALEDKVRALNFSNRVTFTGRLTHESVLLHMLQSDVFFLPSENETFGLVFLESMSKGCIVIGREGTGISGIVNHRRNGLLVKEDPSGVFSNPMLELLSMSDAEIEEMQLNAHQTVSNLTDVAVSSAYLENIEAIVKHR